MYYWYISLEHYPYFIIYQMLLVWYHVICICDITHTHKHTPTLSRSHPSPTRWDSWGQKPYLFIYLSDLVLFTMPGALNICCWRDKKLIFSRLVAKILFVFHVLFLWRWKWFKLTNQVIYYELCRNNLLLPQYPRKEKWGKEHLLFTQWSTVSHWEVSCTNQISELTMLHSVH